MEQGERFPSGPSLIHLLSQKIDKMIEQNNSLPLNQQFTPNFVLGSNHKTFLGNKSVDLLITSPPYKDLDVEYMQIQIQRPESHRSKRSEVISKILDCDQVEKLELCGFKNHDYWENLAPTLKECHRVLKPNKLAFFWTGFKTKADKMEFEVMLEGTGFELLDDIRVSLSPDRSASSRSLHHGKNTGMLTHDYLFVTRRKSD